MEKRKTKEGLKPKRKLTTLQIMGIILYATIIIISLAALLQ